MRVHLRVYAELADFLPPALRQRTLARDLAGTTSVKDLIEGLGIPHTEIDLVLVNGESAGFDRHVRDGDFVSVFPVFESIDIGSVTRVRAEPLRVLRFVLDTHLGRLAAYLRLAGFDTLYRRDYRDDELAAISNAEQRVLLTRDQALLRRRVVSRGYFIRSTHPRRQFRDVIERFDLAGSARPFQRCLRCNAPLRPAARDEVWPRLPPRTRVAYDTFYACTGCDRVYWRGAHAAALEAILADALGVSPRLPVAGVDDMH
jgi:uncharacterized protein with PIN domain